jgi:hypothetical protein
LSLRFSYVGVALGALLFAGACGSVATMTGTGGSGGGAGTSGAAGNSAGHGGTTGSAGTGGSVGTGGAAAGTTGVAGTTGAAGGAGTTGAAGGGGTTGSAGAAGTAGAAGGGGTTGAAGTTGTGGATGIAGHGGATGTAGTGGTTGAGGVAGSGTGGGGATGTGGTGVASYLVTVVPAGTGSGTVTSTPAGINCGTTCSASFAAGTMVTLSAAPAVSSTFAGWSGGGCTGTGNCVVSVSAAASVAATFTLKPITLTITTAGAGAGTVTSSPAGISCGSTCMASFNYGTVVTLTAAPTASSTFMGWSGACSGSATTCMLTLTAAASATANFVPAAPTPLLYWPFDGSNANTGSTAGYSVTLNGSSYVAGKVGQAVSLATGGYGIVSGSARAVLAAYPQYTISFWINLTPSVTTSAAFLDFNNRSTAPYGGIQLGIASASQMSICVATTTSSYLTGSCPVFTSPAASSWHHMILRYAGTGTGTGQGAGVDVYIDDVLVKNVPNDANNNPVFNAGMPDTLYLGSGGMMLDDVRIYNTVFTVANQCTQIIGGTWNGTSCTLP